MNRILPRRLVPVWMVALASIAWADRPEAYSQDAPAAVSSPLPPSAPPTIEELARRVQLLEESNKRLTAQVAETTKQQDDQLKQIFGRYDELIRTTGTRNTPSGLIADEASEVRPEDPGSPVPDYMEGILGPFRYPAGYPTPTVPRPKRYPLSASFGPGFRLQTDDGEFKLEIHYESQVEGRIWDPNGANPPNSGVSGLYLPRQRIFFDGDITKKVEYEFAINRGLNNINILNAFLNFHIDDRFEVRVGRFFTPFSYDQYAVSNYWLLTPERSLFTTNLSPNRQFGVMGWGYLFDQRLDYSAGVFNGSRNSFENVDNNMDFVGFINMRPFQESEKLTALKYWNVGTSVAFGRQDQPPAPVAFRVGAGSPDTNIPGPATISFLVLNPDVVESGDRLVGAVHSAYFYKGLSLIGEWQYGYGAYASIAHPVSTIVPYGGYYVAGGYFLTGEEVERRTRVKPLRPLIPTSRDDERGIGAWEVTARYSELRIGERIFTSGFADPNVWSNTASTTEVGMNWYWNEYLKFYMFWLHADFGDPVLTRPGQLQKAADMVWLRSQLYF
jgi:phosphate-selective porin OprO and OprP